MGGLVLSREISVRQTPTPTMRIISTKTFSFAGVRVCLTGVFGSAGGGFEISKFGVDPVEEPGVCASRFQVGGGGCGCETVWKVSEE